MPRKRKLARAFAREPDASVAAMRKRFADPWRLLEVCDGRTFFRELPTEAERRAFSEEFPEHIYDLFNFFGHETDALPASTMYHFQSIFRRPAEEFTSMIQEHPPRLPFDPPDVSSLHFYPESIEVMAVARGRWWKVNGLPMSSRERAWLEQHDTARKGD